MQPFRTILFAADFSENSLEAFRAACSLAVDNKTRLIVLHVVEPNWVPQDPVYFGQASIQFQNVGREESYHVTLKRKLCEVYAPNHPIDIAFQTKEGNASAEIVRTAEEIGSDLIVMGTHGRTGLRWLLAGSVAIDVLRKARCPVLALRSLEVPRRAEDIRVILHPTDFSESSEGAVRVARSLARDLGARLVILHAAPLEVLIDGTPAAETDVRFFHDELESIRKRLDGPDLKYPVETRLSRSFPPDGILETADEIGADLIVMGTHGRTGLFRALTGSVAESVLPKAECPVMVVKTSLPQPAPTADRPAEEMITVF
jgi:nucleotide-binding universal stress UspA family protein